MMAEAAPLRPRRWLVPLLLAAVTAVVYGWRLDVSPAHLHYDEIFFGLQGHSIQATGVDLNGRRLPVYFQLEHSGNWYQPIGVYATAAVLTVLPLSDASIRVPGVIAAIANVVLMYLVAQHLLPRAWAIVAAVLLMLTPAHLIHSRLAMDYVYPLPFLLGWLLLMLRYLEQPSRVTIFAAALCLGAGFFSYIAGTALTPMFLLATLVVLWHLRHPWSRAAIAAAGFALPLLAGALFIAAYPDVVPHLMDKYGLRSLDAGSAALDPLQYLREAINPRTVSDALNHYWGFFSPGYLFVTGGSNLTNSTRTTGVFLPPLALLMVAGVWHLRKHGPIVTGLLLFGLLAAPIPAAMMPEDYTIDRELAVVPFAVLIAAIGAAHWWAAPTRTRLTAPARLAAAAIAVSAVAYAVFRLAARGEGSGSAPLLLVVAAALYGCARAIDRRRDWAPAVAVLLGLVPLLFVPFYQDYFSEYRLRSSNWFGGNMRGAVREVMRIDGAAPSPEIHLSTDIPYVRSFWTFYLLMDERGDLATKTKVFDGRSIDLARMPPGSLVLAAANDSVIAALAAQGHLRKESGVRDSVDDTGLEQFTIYRR